MTLDDLYHFVLSLHSNYEEADLVFKVKTFFKLKISVRHEIRGIKIFGESYAIIT